MRAITIHYRLIIQGAQVTQIITYRIGSSAISIQKILISTDKAEINLRHPNIGTVYKFSQ